MLLISTQETANRVDVQKTFSPRWYEKYHNINSIVATFPLTMCAHVLTSLASFWCVLELVYKARDQFHAAKWLSVTEWTLN